MYKVQRRAFAGQQHARGAVQFEQRLVSGNALPVGNVPLDLHVVACQLNKDLFYPALTAEDAIFTGDHHRMRARIFRQQLGGNIVVRIHLAAQVFTQGLRHGGGDIQIYTFQQRFTTAIGVVTARRHDKTPKRVTNQKIETCYSEASIRAILEEIPYAVKRGLAGRCAAGPLPAL